MCLLRLNPLQQISPSYLVLNLHYLPVLTTLSLSVRSIYFDYKLQRYVSFLLYTTTPRVIVFTIFIPYDRVRLL